VTRHQGAVPRETVGDFEVDQRAASAAIMMLQTESNIWIAILILGPLLLALWAIRPQPKQPSRRR
jgi:hypothetical protein